MFEMAQLREDALREYDELEQCFLEVALSNEGKGRPREFGGTDAGDDRAALLQRDRKPFRTFVMEDSVKEFDYRQYVFARQATLLFSLGRPGEVRNRSTIAALITTPQSFSGVKCRNDCVGMFFGCVLKIKECNWTRFGPEKGLLTSHSSLESHFQQFSALKQTILRFLLRY